MLSRCLDVGERLRKGRPMPRSRGHGQRRGAGHATHVSVGVGLGSDRGGSRRALTGDRRIGKGGGRGCGDRMCSGMGQ